MGGWVAAVEPAGVGWQTERLRKRPASPLPDVFPSLDAPPHTSAAPRIKEVVQRTIGLAEQPPIPRQGQQFVREQLTREALHCYWLGALQRYAPIYFS